MIWLVYKFAQLLPYIITFSLPSIGVICGVDILLAVICILSTYWAVATFFHQQDNAVLGWLVQMILGAWLLYMKIGSLPVWIVNAYSMVLELSSPLWKVTEMIALFHGIFLMTETLQSWYESESWGQLAKILTIIMSGIASLITALLITMMFLTGYGKCEIVLIPLSLVAFYLMYQKETGNVMSASLVVMFSHVVMYSVHNEIDLYTQTKNGIEACTSNREKWMQSSVASLIWICLTNLYANLGLWKKILNPISSLYLTLRVLFVVFYSQYIQKRDSSSDIDSEDIKQGPSLWRWLGAENVIYRVLVIVMISQTLYSYTQNICKDDSETNTAHEILPPSITIDSTLQFVISRFFQSVLLPAFYIYSLYDDGEAE